MKKERQIKLIKIKKHFCCYINDSFIVLCTRQCENLY